MTDKYLDFSFEKTNSAYMLFYEWRPQDGGQSQRGDASEVLSEAQVKKNFITKNIILNPHHKLDILTIILEFNIGSFNIGSTCSADTGSYNIRFIT